MCGKITSERREWFEDMSTRMRFDSRAWGWASVNGGWCHDFPESSLSEEIALYECIRQFGYFVYIMYLNFRFHVFFDPAELRMSVEKFLATWLCNEASLKLPFFHHWRPLESVWRWRFHPLYSCDANSMLHKFWRPNSLSSEIATMNKENPLPVNGFRLHLVSVFHHVSWSQWFHKIS